MKWDDVSNWAWILSGNSPDEMANRLVSSPPGQPTFILLEILRRDISNVKTLKMLLIYAWDHVLSRPEPKSSSLSKSRPDAMDSIGGTFHKEDLNFSKTKVNSTIPKQENVGFFHETFNVACQTTPLQENSFTILISRLLNHARRIWPPAMVSVSHMLDPCLRSISARSFGDLEGLDHRTFARLCKINNYFLRLLALPSSIEPFKSMVYNWSAQKVLLELAAQFEPPLMLDHSSYRAVVQVLAASKKSERESRSAIFRSRSWPPWRVEQDGMDAQRSEDEDLSRVISAIAGSKESGYRPNLHDQIMSVFGGLDPDGTPTIQTRKLLKWRPSSPSRCKGGADLDVRLWAARVEATRDVHEAWGAFSEFQRKGGKPSMSMYFAMFQKLNYESRRLGRKSDDQAVPGDGREVIAVSDHNFSVFYKSRLQPPTLQELYHKMKVSGIYPSGRCLSFLLRHARTIDDGLRYLLDSGLDTQAVAYLAGGEISRIPADVVAQVSDRLLADFISLVCRFAPRVVQASPDSDLEVLEPTKSNERFVGALGKVLQAAQNHGLQHPLHHAVHLLRLRQPKFRPAWYALFKTLAYKDIVVVRQLATDPARICENHEQAWRITRAALQEFHKCDLELDPHGFLFICFTFAKYAGAAFHDSKRHRTVILETSRIVKAEFANLTVGSEELPHWIPKLLHSLNGVHLHAYVHAMGLIEDHAAIISVLDWMAKNHQELETIASQSRNGHKMLRQTLIATKVFCGGTDYEATAKALVEQVESWNGWPTAEEAQQYIDRGNVRIQSTDGISTDGEDETDEESQSGRMKEPLKSVWHGS
jgi:hypothetical protein